MNAFWLKILGKKNSTCMCNAKVTEHKAYWITPMEVGALLHNFKNSFLMTHELPELVS